MANLIPNDPLNENTPATGDFLFVEGTVYDDDAPAPDNKDIQEVVGEAISGVDGVLALKGGLTDIFKKDEDLTRGISVHVDSENNVNVKAKVISDADYSADAVAQQATEAINDCIRENLGLTVGTVEIDVADTMTRGEFFEKYDAERALH